MNEQQHLQDLSASVDGELARDEWRFLLRRLERDDAMCETWSRYQLIGDSLRKQLVLRANADFSARVQAAIEQEEVSLALPQQAKASLLQRSLRWSMGGAIAASVAVAALLVARPHDDRVDATAAVNPPSSSSPGMSVATTGQDQNAAPPLGAPAAVPAWLNLDPAVRLSQQAAATRGGTSDDMQWMNGDVKREGAYPAIRTGRDSYLLLLDPHAAAKAASTRH